MLSADAVKATQPLLPFCRGAFANMIFTHFFMFQHIWYKKTRLSVFVSSLNFCGY